jgi:hypothetical protein
MLMPISQELSELQRQLDCERDSDLAIILGSGELWQPVFFMGDLFAEIPECDWGPIRGDFSNSAVRRGRTQ